MVHGQSFRGDDVVVLLERSPGDGQGYEYRLLAASSGTSFPQTEATQARGDGCVIAGLVSRGGQHMMVMEREAR